VSQDAGDLAKLLSRLGLLCVMTIVPPIVAGCTAVKDKRAALVEDSSESGGSGWRPMGGAGGAQAPKPAAAGSGSRPAARAGWYCMNVLESCACVETAGATGQCDITPPCCFALTMVGLNACQCWPESSESCRDLRAGATDKKAIPSCPP